MSRRWRIAIVGLGNVAEPHLEAYASLSQVEVIGVAEPRRERREQVCAQYGIPGFDSLDHLLRECRPEIVCILSPASTHREMTLRCAAAGAHVLCEKPMAVTLEDAHVMKRACSDASVQFFYGSSYRFLPAIQRARALIAAGAIGSVRSIVEHAVGGEGGAAYKELSAVHYPVGGPGGGGYGLVDHGIHMLDAFPWLCGAPVSAVFGRGDRSGDAATVEFAVLQMGRITGMLTYDASTWPAELPHEGVFGQGSRWLDGRGWMGERGCWDTSPGNIRIYGTEGAMRLFYYANKLFVNRNGSWQEQYLAATTTPLHFASQMSEFCANLTCGKAPSVTASDGIRALQTLLAIYASESAGAWQALDDRWA